MPTTREEITRALQILKILKKELPKCIKKDVQKKVPLKAGFDVDLIKHYKKDTRFTAEDLHEALYFYSNTRLYLESLVEGTPRVNLEGKKSGKVTAEEEAHAKELLARREKRKFDSHTTGYFGELSDEDTAEESEEASFDDKEE